MSLLSQILSILSVLFSFGNRLLLIFFVYSNIKNDLIDNYLFMFIHSVDLPLNSLKFLFENGKKSKKKKRTKKKEAVIKVIKAIKFAFGDKELQ